ncbi:unnamed protein product [Bursaphelenchus okinawaensis]|uniref:lipoyl(octanoyl) transferase n=1 Tax=Bursaphelenchus okinawaensis TaxID=465554 RepID=A0A811KW92_9BILA|nr:unnamed protein product [Bursaphelenchus okinawaensis]CAG9112356.1 unnamed protein product [Bursaphelenchus okinawaensis]
MNTVTRLPSLRFQVLRHFSSAKEEVYSVKDWHIVGLRNGAIACWHPKKEVPYQLTRPITKEEIEEDRKKISGIYKLPCGPAGPTNSELKELFHTGKTEFQTRTREDRLNYICLIEHDPVFTVGLRDKSYGEEEEKRLKASGADFQRIKRGGLITFHGPGQLVVYPVMDLRAKVDGKSLGVRRFVECLEQSVIDLCTDEFGIKSVGRTSDPGVWVQNDRKVAAIGVQVRHGITTHGMALNCNVDLRWFDHIVPCGLAGKTATSLSHELDRNVEVDDVMRPLMVIFERIFQTKVYCETIGL